MSEHNDTPAQPNCELCGEPMPKGEEMFKYHGYSGPCPEPAAPAVPVSPAFRSEASMYHWPASVPFAEPAAPSETSIEREINFLVFGISRGNDEFCEVADVKKIMHELAEFVRQPAAPSAAPQSDPDIDELQRMRHECCDPEHAKLQARVRELEQQARKLEHACEQIMQERDHWEESLSSLAIAANCPEEWSNLHEHGECIADKLGEQAAQLKSAEAERERLKAALRVTGFTYHLAHANPGVTVSTVEDCPFCKSWVSALAAGAEEGK